MQMESFVNDVFYNRFCFICNHFLSPTLKILPASLQSSTQSNEFFSPFTQSLDISSSLSIWITFRFQEGFDLSFGRAFDAISCVFCEFSRLEEVWKYSGYFHYSSSSPVVKLPMTFFRSTNCVKKCSKDREIDSGTPPSRVIILTTLIRVSTCEIFVYSPTRTSAICSSLLAIYKKISVRTFLGVNKIIISLIHFDAGLKCRE